MATPKVTGPGGTSSEEVIFTTTLGSRFFTGTTDEDTVDMEVSIRGGAFTSDPDFIDFNGTSWTVPNSTTYPDGLDLVAGENRIEVRAISSSGSVSAPAVIRATLIQESDIGVVANPPTNISVERLDGKVKVSVEGLTDTSVQGYNFYAATDQGGGADGYRLINLNLVDSGTTTEEVEEIETVTVDANVATDTSGDPAADPLYVRLLGTQVDINDLELQEDFDQKIEVDETVTAVRTQIVLSSVRTITSYSFEHDRSGTSDSTPATISNGGFASLSIEDPLYYVVTAVYYDETTQVEYESSYSAEVVGNPTKVTATIGSYPTRTRQQITRDYIVGVQRSQPQVRVDPGSILRDTVIDPFASEAQKLRFILDFLHRSQSFQGLLAIDDPKNTGASDDPATNTYKQALKQAFGISKDTDVQALIDRMFDALAARVGIFRRSGTFARSEVEFYTKTRPTRSLSAPLGTVVSGGSVQFRTTKAVSISVESLATYFDPSSGRYKVTAPVQATAEGSSGNVGAGQINSVVTSSVTGLSVINNASAFGGSDLETNKELAERGQNALASADSGRERGYRQTAADVPGVIQVNVVDAGHVLMQRDYNTTTMEHHGGKVDIWMQGENIATVTDTFAFTFDIAQNVQFELIGDPEDYEFRAVDDTLSSENPIVEMLDFPDVGFRMRNATTGEDFILDGVEITSYNTIRLDTDEDQPTVTLTDVVLGDYRYRTGSQFPFPRQPVREIVSVEGAVSGELDSAAYSLFHPSSPLQEGRTIRAGDYLLISGTTDSDGNTVPSGDILTATDEEHTIIGEYLEYLDNLGANSLTVVVKSADGVTTYKGPNDPSGTSDYTLVEGDQTTPLAIKRIESGDIASGSTILVTYNYDENFTVGYKVNQIVQAAQDDVDDAKHLTADVLMKEGVQVGVDLTATIVLKPNTDRSTADTDIRTNLANQFAALRLGEPLRQSDVIRTIDASEGVSYVVTPLTKMVRAEGSQVVRESLTTDQTGDVTYVSAWSTANVSVWLIEEELDAATTTGGGPETEFRGVFEDDNELDLQIVPPETALGLKAGRAYIIGADGHIIQGISDDSTLDAAGYETTTEKEARRIELTANRVLVSQSVDDSPTNHSYSCTYIVGEDTGAKDIDPNDAEYLRGSSDDDADPDGTTGTFTFTYEEDQA